MEGDRGRFRRIGIVTKYFNPLPPHGGRPCVLLMYDNGNPFQSTPSAWRETFCAENNFSPMSFQSTPSAWRETHHANPGGQGRSISIHSLRMEGDSAIRNFPLMIFHFNPLPPHGGRPGSRSHCWNRFHFNPLPPHGGRRSSPAIPSTWKEFQSTPSAWRETEYFSRELSRKAFQSTPSAWRETLFIEFRRQRRRISIHSLRMEGDAARSGKSSNGGISIHSLRMEGDCTAWNPSRR